jgi:hypothetical protein
VTVANVALVSGNIYAITLNAAQAGGAYTVAVANVTDNALSPNAIAATTLSFNITDKTAPTVASAEWVPGAAAAAETVYVTFSEAVATTGVNSALDLNNYRINTAGGAKPTAASLYGTGGTKVKLTFADVAVTDVSVGQIADAAGNVMASLSTIVAAPQVTAITAANITSITTKSLNTVDIVINKVIPTLTAAAFTVEEGAGGADVQAPAMISYSNNGTNTTVTLTLTAATAMTNANDEPDNINFIAGGIVSDIGATNALFTVTAAGITDGIAPTISTITQTAAAKFTVTYDEAVAASPSVLNAAPLIASDFIVLNNANATLLAGVDYTTAIVNGNVEITLAAVPTIGHKYKISTKAAMTYVVDATNTALKANARTTAIEVTVVAVAPPLNIVLAEYNPNINTLGLLIGGLVDGTFDPTKITYRTGINDSHTLTGGLVDFINEQVIYIYLNNNDTVAIEGLANFGGNGDVLNIASGYFTTTGNITAGEAETVDVQVLNQPN